MRITSLRLAGFGPYLEEQSVDFERFADDGIFLITGKTGAGKSSILDAICFALYATVPRYDGSQQRLRSDHAGPDDASWVELEFTVSDIAYRVRRSPSWEKPGRATPVAATAELFRKNGKTWEGIAARPVDVGHEIHQIVQLSKDQFLQVILLAQNRFQQFLRANNDERQSVLRTLFATDRFADIETAFTERRKALEATMSGDLELLQQLGRQFAELLSIEEGEGESWFDEGLAALETLHTEAVAAAERADAEHTALDAAQRLRSDTRALQLRRDTATARATELRQNTETIERDREGLGAARRASIVWQVVTTQRSADVAAAAARAAENTARTAWNAHGLTSEDLGETVRELDGQLGSLADARAEERTLPKLERAVDNAEDRVTARDDALTALQDSLEGLPARIDANAEALAVAQVQAAGEPAARATVERLETALEHARVAASLASNLEVARADENAASARHLAAATRHHGLLEQRLAGHAAELAGELVAGEPCAVCGSTSHPAPATPSGNPVTQEDIDAALEVVEEAKRQLDNAVALRAAVDISLAETIGRTDGRDAESITAEKLTAEEALAVIALATRHQQTLESFAATLRAEADRGAAQLDELRTDRESDLAALTVARTTRDAVAARVTEQRGDHPSVADRFDELRATRDAAAALEEAIAQATTRAETLTDATDALEVALAEQKFDSADAVEAARVADLGPLEARIRAHDEALATAESTLAELAHVEAEPIDLAAGESAAVAARAVRDDALATRSSLAERRTSATRIAEQARVRLVASAGRQADFDQLRELAQAVAGKEPNTRRMRLETYVLAAQLEEIVAAANSRLRAMTSGRFSLEHDDTVQYRNTSSGLGLAILDEHTGRARATHSLSGGETFLASLALALGLAEVVTNQSGGITLDTLFIDEGFGSLDNDTLEIAMSTLDGLRAGGRTIGLISHVDSMKEQILAKLRVSVDGRGRSIIETEGV
ncbi:SMC family ATPase [Glaciihabitans arcticus]|uniref:Nuclease SbcCD subunit C n=1 Tax=Glaciihabitans arcticus TaxID=2668039 RepID=A0A4Q9GP81_9MICO|nr:SMC family ATPase [Glaciihabitans arcticus]TBN56632.1 SMC family ATPase [Glaciihabitans arcticus]